MAEEDKTVKKVKKVKSAELPEKEEKPEAENKVKKVKAKADVAEGKEEKKPEAEERKETEKEMVKEVGEKTTEEKDDKTSEEKVEEASKEEPSEDEASKDEPSEDDEDEPGDEVEDEAGDEAEEELEAVEVKRGRRGAEEKKEEKEKPRTKKARKKPKKKLADDEVYVYSFDGEPVDVMKLPQVFFTEFRPDIIRRAVKASRANRRQPYGPNPMSGQKHAAATWGKGRGVARVQRMTDGRTAVESANNVGGRRAHPPRPERDWSEKVNRKERKQALLSALSAARDREIVKRRGHRFEEKVTLPVIIASDVEEEELDRPTADTTELLQQIGIFSDIERARNGKHIRAGRGKMRGRKYVKPKSCLFVSTRESALTKGLRNLPGVDVVMLRHLSPELLAPGGDPGRLTVFTESALEEMRKW